MSLRPEAARRLAFVRLMLGRAVEESALPAPFSFDSVGRFHDAAEMFLAIAVQELHAVLPKEFIKYWDSLEPHLGRPMQYRAQAERMNKVRVAWKHFGAEPSLTEIERARLTVTGLLEDECEPLFGVAFADVSLAAFIASADARFLVAEAERHWAEGAEADAFYDLADAFDRMIQDAKRSKMVSYDRSLYDFGRDMRFLTSFHQNLGFGKQRDFVDGTIKSIESLDQAVMLLALGLDFRRYGRFRSLTPVVSRFVGGGSQAAEGVRRSPRTTADFEFCRDFVVSSAVHIAQHDVPLDQSEFEEHTTAIYRRGVAEEPEE